MTVNLILCAVLETLNCRFVQVFYALAKKQLFLVPPWNVLKNVLKTCFEAAQFGMNKLYLYLPLCSC